MENPINLSAIPYPYQALEPALSRISVEEHFCEHHAPCVVRTYEALDQSYLMDSTFEEIVHIAYCRNQIELFENAAQAWSHAFYWRSMHPEGGGIPRGLIKTLIDTGFGGLSMFENALVDVAVSYEGNGWLWLIMSGDQMRVVGTHECAFPLLRYQTPILGIDLWEHAYWRDYGNRKDEYVSNVVRHLLNWDFANDRLLDAGVNTETIDFVQIQELSDCGNQTRYQ